MQTLRRSHRLIMASVWFLTVFLVLFPKGGIKIGPVPLTWGYLFIAVLAAPALVVRLLCLPLRLPFRAVVAALTVLPMQVLIAYALIAYGIVNPSYSIATLVGFLVLPVVFLFLFPPFLPMVDGNRFARYLRLCILIAALWGLFLFFWRPFMGYFIEVPLLTVNLADYGQLETTKYIQRGFFFKLISTYNNGNIYGVCMLMMVPLYNILEKSRWRRWAVKLSLLLTLSRTVWVGLIFAELLPVLSLISRQFVTFPRLRLKGAVKSILMVALTFTMVIASLLFNSTASLDFLFDPSLGNRASTLNDIFTAPLLPDHGLNFFSEIVYASAARELGLVGFVAFILLMLGPALLLMFDTSALSSPARNAAFKGLMLYAVVAGSDGGINYIPVLAFYWFLYMIYLYDWPQAHTVRAVQPAAAPIAPSLLGAHS